MGAVTPRDVRCNTVTSLLLEHLHSPNAPFKDRVIAVLIQILSRPHLFSTADPPHFRYLATELAAACADKLGVAATPENPIPSEVQVA